MISEYLDEAEEELKRVTHLVYVSLKYTRTVDVLLNIISRMIDGYEKLWDALLEKLREDGVIEEIPRAPVVRAKIISENFDQDIIMQSVQLYLLLRKLHRSNPEREQEYRRHVTMRTIIDGREEIVNIDIITQFHHLQREFHHWLAQYLMTGKDPDEEVED